MLPKVCKETNGTILKPLKFTLNFNFIFTKILTSYDKKGVYL